MSDQHYFYGRIAVDPQVAKMFLDRNGVVATKNAEGALLFTVYQYASNLRGAMALVRNLTAFAAEVSALADDMEHFIECYDFTQPVGAQQEECLR